MLNPFKNDKNLWLKLTKSNVIITNFASDYVAF